MAVNRELKRHLSPGELAAVLTKELIHEEKNNDKTGVLAEIKRFFRPGEDDSEDENENKSE